MTLERLKAVLIKEFIQMGRSRVTFMMVMLPVVQLLVFGFAINTDVKHLPTVILINLCSKRGGILFRL